MIELNYPLFDGEKVWEAASVTVENGVITGVTALSAGEVDTGYFLMPGLIDAHTHVSASEQIAAMLRSGITATCDVSASAEMIRSSGKLNIVSSAGMAMGFVVKGKSYVEKAVAGGAKYIKVICLKKYHRKTGIAVHRRYRP